MDQPTIEKKFPGNSLPAALIAENYFFAKNLQLSYFSPLYKKQNQFIKRSVDIIIALFLIITILSWLIPVIAFLIKADSPGPIFFRQKRNREGSRLFTCIKFRTMILNVEADVRAATENDNRITKFGKYLRFYHLDELPQLINVLIGDMSLVGPRPYMPADNIYYENLIDTYALRHSIKPGITGLAQSFGYYGSFQDLDKLKERWRLDILYIRNWSLAMDMKIMYRTFMSSFGFNYSNELNKLDSALTTSIK